jgi:hypothetical protein
MNWVGKSRLGVAGLVRQPRRAEPAATPATPNRSSEQFRLSNSLKNFLWLIGDVEHGRLLDLGPVWQATVSFFVERGFRLTTEDMLRSWKEYLNAEEDRVRCAPAGEDAEVQSPADLAAHFMEYALQYPPEEFHAVLAWDIFDYLSAELLPRVASRLHEIVRPSGVVLALFHSRAPAQFHRYRIADHQTIELVPAMPLGGHKRVFQNREILNLFGDFRSAKTFVGRDQLREGLFIR